MKDMQSTIPFSFQPRSLAWEGDELVDWVGGGTRWSNGHEAGLTIAPGYGVAR
ncbi:MAG: hypothetical protein WC804_08770 [Sphingomonas sp.]|jgi:hypothetical protein|uniref:hypothetical protein n=1 Tax=Sphingomonas sp. TaxID=28214 RepID=UPI003566711B